MVLLSFFRRWWLWCIIFEALVLRRAFECFLYRRFRILGAVSHLHGPPYQGVVSLQELDFPDYHRPTHECWASSFAPFLQDTLPTRNWSGRALEQRTRRQIWIDMVYCRSGRPRRFTKIKFDTYVLVVSERTLDLERSPEWQKA